MTTAPDTFAIDSSGYARARPRYPPALYDWILDHAPRREAVWDCATGNGQAARDLADHFERVFASDISTEQVARAAIQPNIDYRAAPAETSGYPDAAFDLITVAQALHWFDYSRFWPEVRRVARPDGFFCAWGYAWFSAPAEIDRRLVQPFREMIAPYWAANNQLLWRGYQPAEVEFPFAPLRPPPLVIELKMSARDLVAYLRTWSAYKLAVTNEHLSAALAALMDSALSDVEADAPMEISMPLAVIAGHVRGSR
jgi:SAM-dependent methyltransferase